MPSPELQSLDLADLARNDPAAWKVAFAVLWPLAWRVIHAMLHDQSETDDVAAEAVSQLPGLVAKVKSAEELEPMMVVVARRSASSHLRARFARKRDARLLEDVEHLDALPDGRDLRREVEQTHDLQVWLGTLDERRRKLVEAHFIEGKTSVELEGASDLNESTVRGLLGEGVRIMHRAASREGRGQKLFQRMAASLRLLL